MYQRHLKRSGSAPSRRFLTSTSRPGRLDFRYGAGIQDASRLRFRSLLIWLLIWLLTPLLLLLLDAYSNLDLALADLMFDPIAGQFSWRHAWLTDTFGHQILKTVLSGGGGAIVLACIGDLIRPFTRWNSWLRLRLRTVALSAIAIPGAISLLKSISAPHCPWDLQRYDGLQAYVRLLEALPHGVAPGHCFPAGHASSALWLAAIGVFWWPHRPRTAAIIGGGMLTIGFAVGWMQQMRGAHFLSHTLWSTWIAATIVVAVFIGLRARENKRRLRAFSTADGKGHST